MNVITPDLGNLFETKSFIKVIVCSRINSFLSVAVLPHQINILNSSSNSKILSDLKTKLSNGSYFFFFKKKKRKKKFTNFKKKKNKNKNQEIQVERLIDLRVDQGEYHISLVELIFLRIQNLNIRIKFEGLQYHPHVEVIHQAIHLFVNGTFYYNLI